MRFRLYVLFLLCSLFFQCRSVKSVESTNAPREVFMVSGGYNAANGHHVLQLSAAQAEIDTSYYLGKWELFAGCDTAHFYNHLNAFNVDMKIALNRMVYKKLLTLPLDTLRAYEQITQTTGHEGYSFQEITIRENGKVHAYNFQIHADKSWLPENISTFITELEVVFPFRVGAYEPAIVYYQ